MDGLDLSLDSLQFGGFRLDGDQPETGDQDLLPEPEFVVDPWYKQIFCCFTWYEMLKPVAVGQFDGNFGLLEDDLFGDVEELPKNEDECFVLAKQESNNSLL